MAAVRANADKQDKPGVYRNQITQLRELNTLMNEQAMASGEWHVQNVKSISASERFTNQVRQQKLGLSQLTKELKAYSTASKTGGNSVLGEAIKEQISLRNAMATQMTSSVFGKNNTSLMLPKNLGPELDSARVKYGMINEMIRSAATQTVNWGKNTQWAGRQITVGLTVPLGMAAVGAAALAMQVDQNLTRIAKVYDTTNKNGMAQEQELKNLREESLTTATRLAQNYGTAMQDALDISAQLAATGLTGAKLQQATTEVARIAALGELEPQKAIDMTIALQTAFKDTIKTSDDLTNTFNMMNAVENATSLSIQDIAEAVPRAASAFSALGGSVADLTVMMTAMKESGVDPAVGANAIKSATARLLDPTKEAITYFEEKFGIDLPKIVEEADGKVFDLIKRLSSMTAGEDNLDVQTGIGKLFGTYQFDRATALWHNLGDAVNGVQNQTRKAMDTVGQSAEQLASVADTELKRWQESVSGRFKRSIESLKASLVPFGLTMLGIVTPVIEAIAKIVDAFNNLPGPVKVGIGILLGLAAVAGPILMLVGIFANLLGNVMKMSTWFANLRLKFRALNTEEATAEIMARQASSAFDTQARSAAVLAANIRGLTEAMEAQALANGMMDSTSMGVMGTAHQRQVVTGANGALRYASGSRDENGVGIGGRIVTKADRENFEAMQKASAATADNAVATERNYSKIGKAVGVLGGAAALFTAMKVTSDSTLSTWINIGLTVAGISMMFPNMFSGALGMATKMKSTMSGMFSGGNFAKNAGVLKNAFSTNGIKGVNAAVKEMAPRFAQIASTAGRIFLPLGILAAGIVVLNQINDKLNEAERHQKALASSGEAWANTLGYTYSPGQLPGLDESQVNNSAKIAEVTQKMTEANKELAPALIEAAKAGNIYQAAMAQALKVVSSGGTAANAKEAFQASLEMAAIDKPEMDKLLIKFNTVDLDNPDEIRSLLTQQIGNALDGIGKDNLAIRNSSDSVWSTITAPFRKGLGGDISSEARAAGEAAGNALAEGLKSTADPRSQARMYEDVAGQLNDVFKSAFNDMMKDDDIKKAVNGMEIKTSEEFRTAFHKIQDKVKNNKDLSKVEQAFWDAVTSDDGTVTAKVKPFMDQYSEMLDTIIQGMVDSGALTQAAADKIRDSIMSITDLKIKRTGISDAGNAVRGVGNAAADLENKLHGAEAAAKGLDNALNGIDSSKIESADRATSYMRSAMEGTMSDIYAEADRIYQARQDAALDGIRARGEATMDALDARAKSMDKYWDQAEKNQEASFKAANKAQEDAWDGAIKRIEDERDAVDKAYEARIDAVNRTIEAEREAEDERKRIFEAEQTRISRMAESFNANIDFNAALSSGNLDEAAKLSNDASARQQTWSMEDAQAEAEQRSQAREKVLQDQIESIQAERDARKEAYDEQLDQIKTAKDTAMEALRERQEAEKEALQERRQMAQDGLAAERDAAQRRIEANVNAAQKAFEADRNSLAQRLRELQAFVPRNEQEMREHIGRIEEAYRIYGGGLMLQGNAWSQFIGNSLRSNIVTASNALATDVNWQALGDAIASRIESGVGVTAGDLQYFIQNGKFPTQSLENYAAEWRKIFSYGLGRNGQFAHEGGIVRHGGGPSWTSKDRTGVPRTASIYPSEVSAILKRGEFVVNEKATRQNRALLESINNGGPLIEPGDGRMLENISRHTGGVAETAQRIPGGYGSMYGMLIEGALGRATNENLAVGQMLAQMTTGAGGDSAAGGWTGAMTGTLNGALDFARSQQGKPYIWGGAGPAGQDCSGFMSIIADFILGKQPPYGRIFATGSMAGGPASVGPFKRGGGPANAFRIGVDPNSHTAGTLAGVNVESGSGHGPMVGGRALGANSNFQYQYYLPQADMVPKLDVGGQVLYGGLAELHPRETVLTAPLSRDLKTGIQEFASGQSNAYNLTIDLRGSTGLPDDTVDMLESSVRKVIKQVQKEESFKRPRGKVVT